MASRIMRICNKLRKTSEQYVNSNIICSRKFNTGLVRRHGEYEWQEPKSEEEIVNVTFRMPDGKCIPIRGKIGDNLMYLAHRHNIPLEGACEASLACTTCHVYCHNHWDQLSDIKEEEEDLLDMAAFLKENSRLGCQIILSKELEGLEVEVPQGTRNFYVDGHVPKPH